MAFLTNDDAKYLNTKLIHYESCALQLLILAFIHIYCLFLLKHVFYWRLCKRQ